MKLLITISVTILVSACASSNQLQNRMAELEREIELLRGESTFEEITVNRINLIDADGTPRMILHNAERMPGEWERSAGAGFTIYAPDGQEVGGLHVEGDVVRFNLDQHGTNEVTSYFTHQTPFGSQRGLTVWDQYPGAPGDGQRARFKELVGRDPNPREIMIPRMFSGQRFGESIVVLGDSNGNERIRLYVDGSGQPRLEFLDERGAVTFHLPANATPAILPDGEIPEFNGETVLQLLALAGNNPDTLLSVVEMDGGSLPDEWVQWLTEYKRLNPR
ncbi:hypothetical protein [Pseudohongiella spirulinae]|uniref:Lipoprotein n=1 Tax=Pseudohongiella spirulinae TaxID=1249552 RepID=A0A0S2K965_9GAMM|nr:hypothetical protein [Pseudohongiella spirulinae]ALO44881.1 hypothetical protein PS2015_187 [Pseudohongiella spirulinae]